MHTNWQRAAVGWGTSLILGLFVGRGLSELATAVFGPLPWMIATLVTIISVGGAAWVRTKRPGPSYWPLAWLLLYVIWPHPDPRWAVVAALLAGLTGWLAGRRPRPTLDAHRIAVVLTGLFFLLYVATLAPGLLPADNGEFQWVATTLDVAHPPGFPLYTLLGHLATRLPLPATPAYKLNLFSAVTSSLTLLLVYLSALALTQKRVAGITAVLALGTATTFWAQATTANIRSLTALFAALVIYGVLRFYETHHRGAKGAERKTGEEGYLVLAAAALGVGLTHHASLVFMGVVVVAFVFVADPVLLRRPRRWIRPILAALLGLLPLLYLPWRDLAGVADAEGLATLDGFLFHVLALGFRGDLFHFTAPAELWQRLQVMGNVMTFQFNDWLLLGMGLGLLLMLWRDRRLALLLAGSFAIHTAVTATYRAPQTVEYMLPAYVPAVLGLAYAVGQIGEITEWARHKINPVFAAGMIVAALWQGWQHYPSFVAQHRDDSVRDYTQSILEAAPPDSVILAHWHWFSPLRYLQRVESLRPDVRVEFVFPRGEPYAETWARLAREEWENGRPAITTHYDAATYTDLPPPQPINDAFLFSQTPLTQLPPGFNPLTLTLGNTIEILGYQLENPQTEIGRETTITLAWRPLSTLQSPISIFTHLVNTDGAIYAHHDQPATAQAEGITLTQFRLTPRPGALPGEYAVMVGARGETSLRTNTGEARTRIDTMRVTARKRPFFSQHPLYRPTHDQTRTLVGYDWDHTLPDRPRLYLHWQTGQGYVTDVREVDFTLPSTIGPWGISQQYSVIGNWYSVFSNRLEYYVPFGEGLVWLGDEDATLQSPVSNPQSPIPLPQTFAAGEPVNRDLAISVRLVGYEDDGFHWAWWDLQDGIPAMGAIPTLKWIGGSVVVSPYEMGVGETAESGQEIGGILRVYDAFTNRPLPILDERIAANGLGVPLGRTTLAK